MARKKLMKELDKAIKDAVKKHNKLVKSDSKKDFAKAVHFLAEAQVYSTALALARKKSKEIVKVKKEDELGE